jgi:hypothetical protein
MPSEIEEPRGDDAETGRWLRDRLPRYPASPRFRSALIQALAPPPARRARPALWLAPAASALATAMIMLLWLAPSLPSSAPPDPLRPLARAVLNEHARTVLWGESRPDVVPAVLPRAMEESGVSLNWVFTGDDRIQLINAQPTYLEGRRGIELAYQDVDGHAVTYLILPAPSLVLPERGRVQVDRWRPLVRTENGYTLLLWKQQGLLCALVSDLVSDEDFDKLKEYFVKVRSSTEPFAVY